MVEIGPGPGGLTRALLATNAASVTAIEVDPRAVAAIEELTDSSEGRLRVVADDALAVDLPDLVSRPRAIVANLPYNIGTRLLVRWLGQAAQFERMTLMFQQEVAERICAAPGTPAYGRLAVLAQWTCRTDLAFRVPPSAFVPPPKIWSAVVRLDPKLEQP